MAIKRKADASEIDSQWAFSNFGDDFLHFEAVAAKQSRQDERLLKNVDRMGEKIDTIEDKIATMKRETQFVDSLLNDLFGQGDASNSSAHSDVTDQSKNYCNYCDLSFASNAGLCIHMLDRHVVSTKKVFFCFACRYHCENLDVLEQHAAKHCQHGSCPSNGTCSGDHSMDEMVRLKLVCDFCPYTDVNIASFQVHCLVCTNNPSNKNYTPTDEGRVCPTCSQVFNTNAYMLKHISLKHRGPNQDEIVKKFACEECGRRFVSSSSLAGHKKVHNKQTTANFTNSKTILKPQERALKIHGHGKPASSRPWKVPIEKLFKSVAKEPQQESGPVEDMPDLF